MYKYLLANICNDVDNMDDYDVVGTDAYYKGELIGEVQITTTLDRGIYTINTAFKSIFPVTMITFTGFLKI